MKVALINPNWRFDGSIYFGCREPHLPLEFGISKRMLEAAGHAVAAARRASVRSVALRHRRRAYRVFIPDMTVVTTAPTLSVLALRAAGIARAAGIDRARSAPERAVYRRCRAAWLDHPARQLPQARCRFRSSWANARTCWSQLADTASAAFAGTCYDETANSASSVGPRPRHSSISRRSPGLTNSIRRHRHHHHRFDAAPAWSRRRGRGVARLPVSLHVLRQREFPQQVSSAPAIDWCLTEIDWLRRKGSNTSTSSMRSSCRTRRCSRRSSARRSNSACRPASIYGSRNARSARQGGLRLRRGRRRKPDAEGREALDKRCRLSTEELAERLTFAKAHIPFVQANLIEMPQDDDEAVQRWRDRCATHGVWANDPVPLFPYPGSPDYRKLWGEPDDDAWERAHEHYLEASSTTSATCRSNVRATSPNWNWSRPR